MQRNRYCLINSSSVPLFPKTLIIRIKERQKIEKPKIQTIIMGMDGVNTDTVRVNTKGCKQKFVDFLGKKEGDDFVPLDSDKHYKQYIDGISRLDGIHNFIQTRNLRKMGLTLR